MNAILVRLKRIFWIKFIFDVFERFGRDNGGLLAGGLAFFLVLAFVPLLLVGLWALGLVYAHKPDEAVVQRSEPADVRRSCRGRRAMKSST